MKADEILKKSPLPCPFCGATDITVSTLAADINFENPTKLVYSSCNKCGVKSPYTKTVSALTDSNVITATGYELWNKRSSS